MKKTEKVTVIVFTDRAKAVGAEAARILESGGYAPEVLDGREVKISAEMERIFSDFRFIVFVSAVGIAVRLIAPFVRAKDRDPGIVAADEGKNFVISLLSGHLGGANELKVRGRRVDKGCRLRHRKYLRHKAHFVCRAERRKGRFLYGV